MQRLADSDLRPFVSILLLIVTLFAMVFMKTEVRHLGYRVLKEKKVQKSVEDELRIRKMEFVRSTRPESIQKQAVTRLTLGEARAGQIIQMIGDRAAVPQ